MRLNSPVKPTYTTTFEGGKTLAVNDEKALRRAVLACLLWEDTFYESGEDIATRIQKLSRSVKPQKVVDLALEAKKTHKLRHVPLWVMVALLDHPQKSQVNLSKFIVNTIQRPDELAEILAMYWKDGRKPLANQLKVGLSAAFSKFNAFELLKWNKNDAAIKLRDVMFLVHPTPCNEEQAKVFKAIANNVSTTEAEKVTQTKVDTWERRLSAGADKAQSFIELMEKNKLGATAFISNVRNMVQAGVPEHLIRDYARKVKTELILPFRFVSAARAVPQLEDMFEEMMLRSLASHEKLPGRTALVIDVSGSMFGVKVAAKSELERFDAAAALAMLAREICETVDVYSFSDKLVRIPARRGFALREAISNSQRHGGTYLRSALDSLGAGYDRVIVFTDGESHDGISNRIAPKQYMLNVAAYHNAVAHGAWEEVQGFSESVMRYILELEKDSMR